MQNLADLNSYEAHVTRFAKVFSNIDIAILINNAGIGFTGPYYDMSSKEAETLFALNCFHPVYLAKKIMEQQLKRTTKSAIVVVSSLMGFYPFPCHTYYSCSKVFVRYMYEGLFGEA